MYRAKAAGKGRYEVFAELAADEAHAPATLARLKQDEAERGTA
jgi:hypothetical protein